MSNFKITRAYKCFFFQVYNVYFCMRLTSTDFNPFSRLNWSLKKFVHHTGKKCISLQMPIFGVSFRYK